MQTFCEFIPQLCRLNNNKHNITKFMFRPSKTEGVDNNQNGIVTILLICGYELKIKFSQSLQAFLIQKVTSTSSRYPGIGDGIQ